MQYSRIRLSKRKRKHRMQVFLLFVDDVARIVGLCVLHKRITTTNLHCIDGRLYLDLRLSSEVVAHYLTVLSFERISTHLDFGRDFPDSSFPMDNNVKALLMLKCVAKVKYGTQRNYATQIVYRRIDSTTNSLIAKETVIELLMEIALENMTSFYSVILKDFGIQCNTANCYRALYLYNCLQYDEAVQLCEGILNEPDLQSDIKELSFANVFVMPPLHTFFDVHVQSLLGIHTLFYYLSPMNDYLKTFEVTDDSTFEHWFAYFRRNELSPFLF